MATAKQFQHHSRQCDLCFRFGGSGLGLSICKKLAEAMGGKMWVESDGLGQGSLFRCATLLCFIVRAFEITGTNSSLKQPISNFRVPSFLPSSLFETAYLKLHMAASVGGTAFLSCPEQRLRNQGY